MSFENRGRMFPEYVMKMARLPFCAAYALGSVSLVMEAFTHWMPILITSSENISPEMPESPMP